MLSIGVLAAGDEAYYLAVGSQRAGPARADEYYTDDAEQPGRWVGAASRTLGLSGTVAPEDLHAVLAGHAPPRPEGSSTPDRPVSASEKTAGASGEKAQGNPEEAEEGVALVGGRRSRPGLYLTFSAPKGVSLVGLLGDTLTASEVQAAHDQAVADTLAHLEANALFARRGRNGQRRIPTGGFVAAAFDHTTSRAGDPQLHTHVLVANMVQGVDGRWSTPDSRSLFRYARTAGFVYQAALRARLTETVGLGWGPVRRGMAEPAGIANRVLREFSTRRRQVEARLAEHGATSPAAAQVAAIATRPTKDHQVTAAVLRDSWRAQAATVGLTAEHLAELTGPGRRAASVEDLCRLFDRLVGPAGLTAQATSFDRRAVLRALAEAAGDGAHPAVLDTAADQLLADPRVILLAEAAADHLRQLSPEPTAPQRVSAEARRWTTRDLLDTEAALVASAVRRRATGTASVTPGHLDEALASRPGLSDEQQTAVRRLVGDGDGVAVLVGRAGTGKTFALDAARAAWNRAGMPVVGAAPSARAAAELQAGSGIPSTTLARLLLDAQTPEPGGGLPARGVVVVDEAGMAGTRHLHRLAVAAEASGTKVVLVGDPAQLPEIDAGGALAALARRLDAPMLVDNRRQVEAWERAALARLRAGQAARAVAVYRDHGRLVVVETAADARCRLVGDWWKARTAGQAAAMFALRRGDVAALNALARQLMADSGRLGPLELEAAGRRFAIGDDIVALRNDRRLGVRNGSQAVVTGLDPAAGTLTVTLPHRAASARPTPGPETIVLSADYVAAGHVDHAYALTLHKAQGVTVDRAFLLGSDTLYREAGYVGLSRGRHSNDLYLVAATEPDPEAHTHPSGQTLELPSVETHNGAVDALVGALATSRAQTLASASGLPTPAAGRSLAELHHQRDALADTLLGPGAKPEQGDLSGPVDRTVLARWHALGEAIDERARLLGRAALADPPGYLCAELGPPPPSGLARVRWAQAATTVEAYRDRYAVTDPASALGPAPADPWARLAHQHAAQVIGAASRDLDHQPTRAHQDRSTGRGVDR